MLDNVDAVPYIGTTSAPTVMYFIFYSFVLGGLFCRYVTPMLYALASGTLFADDYESGYYLFCLQRGSIKSYLRSKYLVGTLWGGLTAGLGTALLICVLSASCPPINEEQIDAGWYYIGSVTATNGLPYYIVVVYYQFLVGCIYTGIAICASAFYPRRYFALTAPFIASFVMIQGMKTARIPNEMRPDQWLSMRTIIVSEGITVIACTAITAILLCIMSIIFCKRGRRVIGYA